MSSPEPSAEELPGEVWRPVLGWEGRYWVSDAGRVKGLAGLMKPQPNTTRGYPQIGLKRAPLIRSMRYVHHLVLEAFVGPAPANMECLHRDDDPVNNQLSNLRWGTRAENLSDRIANGIDHHTNQTHCKYGHPLSEGNLDLAALRRKRRVCLTCKRKRAREWARNNRRKAAWARH